jgi:hypothetical protein
VLGERDVEVREAFMLWRMQEMNISEMTIRPDEAEEIDLTEP